MKKLLEFIKNKTISFIKWVWSECKDWRTFCLLILVSLVIGLPVWGGYLIGFVFHIHWAIVVASICWAFWMLPGAPFFALSISITLLIKKWIGKGHRKIKTIAKSILNTDKQDTDPPNE